MTSINTLRIDCHSSIFSHSNHICEDVLIRLFLYTDVSNIVTSPVLLETVGVYDWGRVIYSRVFQLLQLLNSAKSAKVLSREEVFRNERRHPKVCPDDAIFAVHTKSSALLEMLAAVVLLFCYWSRFRVVERRFHHYFTENLRKISQQQRLFKKFSLSQQGVVIFIREKSRENRD